MSRYIDAEKLERFFKRDEWGTPDERWRPESEFGRFVDTVPTEDVAPFVHAHWIHDGSQWKYSFICSNCGQLIVGERTEDMPYCMGCGAKMDEEEM